jgi:hypothetical protein
MNDDNKSTAWYANKTFVTIILGFGILLLLKEVVVSYQKWNPLSIVTNILWILIILFVIAKFYNRNKQNKDENN